MPGESSEFEILGRKPKLPRPGVLSDSESMAFSVLLSSAWLVHIYKVLVNLDPAIQHLVPGNLYASDNMLSIAYYHAFNS